MRVCCRMVLGKQNALRSDFRNENQSHAPLSLLFREKSRLRMLGVYKCTHNAFAALPTFHGGSRTQKRREKIKTGSGTQNGRPLGVAPTASGQAALRSDFRNENQSHAPLSLLFREKSRLRMLGVYKCTHNAFAALPTFHGIYGERSTRREKRVHPLRYNIGRKKA